MLWRIHLDEPVWFRCTSRKLQDTDKAEFLTPRRKYIKTNKGQTAARKWAYIVAAISIWIKNGILWPVPIP
jgi:hypothetical protein